MILVFNTACLFIFMENIVPVFKSLLNKRILMKYIEFIAY
jgi:hypothetical protein